MNNDIYMVVAHVRTDGSNSPYEYTVLYEDGSRHYYGRLDYLPPSVRAFMDSDVERHKYDTRVTYVKR